MNTEDKIWICSVDVGKVNFCFYVEEMDKKMLQSIQNLPLKFRYNEDGTPTESMEKLLKKVYMNGKTILHVNSDLTKNCKKGKYLDPETFHNMTDLLDSYGEYWDKCSIFIIEQQMAFRGVYNTMALKLGQHCNSYFRIRYGRFKMVIEFPAYHKTSVLGAKKIEGKKYKNGNKRWKTIDKPARKKWSIAKATEILTERGEESIITNLKTKAKKDDLSDTLCQLQAFKYLNFIDQLIQI
jgi:hypothetical protein